MPDYFDDEGNKISKNAWKKLQKRKKSEANRAKKAAAKPKVSKKQKDEELDPTVSFSFFKTKTKEEKSNNIS
jgi:hypothetical protein